MLRIAIADRQQIVHLDKVRLRRIVRGVLRGESVTEAEIGLAFVDDAAIHRINRHFLRHDEPTDVITFPMSVPGVAPLVGEIVVSTETARRRARELGHPAAEELALYVLHGLLHLCGFDDHRPKDRRAMRSREAHYATVLGIALKKMVDAEGKEL